MWKHGSFLIDLGNNCCDLTVGQQHENIYGCLWYSVTDLTLTNLSPVYVTLPHIAMFWFLQSNSLGGVFMGVHIPSSLQYRL